MNTKGLACKVLVPAYGIIVAGSILENLLLGTEWFLLGSVIGLLWLVAGVAGLALAVRELRKGEGYMLVESGPFAWSRNPILAANLLGIMPGLCLILNTNLGILGIAVATFLFFKNVGAEEVELEDQFGETYQAYRERVSRLIPLPSCPRN
ncbi:protein-S-isoprenylcysteine O-methyltransferase Ste14 [Desulfomicrobium macestii]|uniref:Protein-S-isoprenylcysteine O-methyltransferase Ste14 n=1 Tax=Desulfomicrobium macestii TaxID=90731 RepID=A0ABR9H2U6_9BACT|nr:isoprenylcysteine carboxylmethyltransferase family protein [Desulfomicrobium macestii]MBE1425034.1 protein-S-isoprenylcysteine O-methyltransferase Ste14 [Desulfomicrobium macestii]